MASLNVFSLFEPALGSKILTSAGSTAASKASKDAAGKIAAKEAKDIAAAATAKAAKDAAAKASKAATIKGAKLAAAAAAAAGSAVFLKNAEDSVNELNNKVFSITSIEKSSTSGSLLITYTPSTDLSKGASVIFSKTLITKLDGQTFEIKKTNNSTSFTIEVDSDTFLKCDPGNTSPDAKLLNICDASFTYQTTLAIEAAKDLGDTSKDIIDTGLGGLGSVLGDFFPNFDEYIPYMKKAIYFILFIAIIFILWKVGLFSLVSNTIFGGNDVFSFMKK